MNDRKLALVFSGGGAKGVFGVGVLLGLLDRYPTLRWHMAAGSSTGSLIAPFAALGAEDRDCLDSIRRLYVGARRRSVLGRNLSALWIFNVPTGFYHFGPLERLIGQHVTPRFAEALLRCGTAVLINAVSLQTGRRIVFTQGAFRDRVADWFDGRSDPGEGARVEAVSDAADLRRAMLASASIPMAVEPIEFGGDLLVDGGVLDIAPLRAAVAAGATHIVAILMSPRRSAPARTRFSNLIRVGMRSLELISDEVLRNDVRIARMMSTVSALSHRVEHAPPEVRRWCEANLPELCRPRPRRVIEIETIEPEHDIGRTLDFDGVRSEGWPEDPSAGPDRPIMAARYEYGRRTAGRCLERQPGLAAMLASFAG